MTFLAPFALLGLLLLILPIVVHLFKPRKMRQTPFSSLRWLKQTHQRLSRRIQWHQWLLFLLRAACILLLVLALAKPLVGTWGQTRTTDRFIIIDGSRSMACQVPDMSTPFERALDLASLFAQNAQPGERTALVLSGLSPRLVAPLRADVNGSLPELRALKPGLADTDFGASLAFVRSILPATPERDVELVFLTDNLKPRWQQQDVQSFLRDTSRPASVKVIDVGPGQIHNGWLAGARLFQSGPDQDRWLRVEVGSVGEARQLRTVRLTVIPGISDDVQTVALKPGQLARADFKLPANIPLKGQVAELHLEPHDALPSDDVFFLNLDMGRALQVLVIEPKTTGPDDRSDGLFLRAGIEALSATTNQAFHVTNRTEQTVTSGDLAKADVIVLAGVPELTDSALESLEKRVRAGAGLAVFLGSQIKSAFYSQKLYHPQQPAEGLLPLPLKSDAAGFLTEGNPGSVTQVRWVHPLLNALQDPVLNDWAQTRFRVYAAFAGTIAKEDSVLARFDDETPAIVDHPLGAGRVLLFNTSANDDWSDLPRRKSFVPLIDHMLSYLSTGGVKHRFTVGDSLSLPVLEYKAGDEIALVGPGGARPAFRLLNTRGQTLLHRDALDEAGVYRVIHGPSPLRFVVNAGRTDSALSPMDDKALTGWWSPVPLEVLSSDTAMHGLEAHSSRWPFWPALLALAGLFLLAETIYVYRLCPRANPKAAQGAVTQRGMLRPLNH